MATKWALQNSCVEGMHRDLRQYQRRQNQVHSPVHACIKSPLAHHLVWSQCTGKNTYFSVHLHDGAARFCVTRDTPSYSNHEYPPSGSNHCRLTPVHAFSTISSPSPSEERRQRLPKDRLVLKIRSTRQNSGFHDGHGRALTLAEACSSPEHKC